VKDTDETPLGENESEVDRLIRTAGQPNAAYALLRLYGERIDEIGERIDRLLVRIANLETQRTPQAENDDPEWFG